MRKRGEKEGGEKDVEMDSILQKGILVSLSTQFDEATLTSSHDIAFFKGVIQGGSPQPKGLR